MGFVITRMLIFAKEFTYDQIMDEDHTELEHVFDLKGYVGKVTKKHVKVLLDKYNYKIEVELLGKKTDKLLIFSHGIMNARARGYKYAKY
jgi:hypothetical protein